MEEKPTDDSPIGNLREKNHSSVLPDGWEATTYRLTGNFKLVAQFEHEEFGTEVRVMPYKTYRQPGFPNAHRVVLVKPEQGYEEVAVGMAVEHVEEAESAAVDVMQSIVRAGDAGGQSEGSNKNDQ